MKILLATPLYPPEVAEPAPYVKELARRLASEHAVTLIAYTHLPETVPGVHIVTIEKHLPLPIRLFVFLRTLLREMRDADILYAINGASIELPVLLASFVRRTQIVFAIADVPAHKRAQSRILTKMLERRVLARATQVTDFPLERPEILPIAPVPTHTQDAWRASWERHLHALKDIFTHA